jgi:ADP-heptose:LPS heptosyltransferase
LKLKSGAKVKNFRRTCQLPFDNEIPNYIDVHLRNVNKYKRYLKYLRRAFFIYIKGQKNLEIFKILPEHKHILWINISAPSLGDSLMDLSARIMLLDKKIDLFTDRRNSHIYEDDLVFNNIYTSETEVKKSTYDLVIIDSYSTRSMRIKSKIASDIYYVGVYAYFNGPEVNRILFSFHQINNLLGNFKTEDEINLLAKNSITISENDQEIIEQITPKKYISFVLGGEWSYKTYEKWSEVIEKIIAANKELHIVFIGSENAKFISKKIIKFFPQALIYNFVSKLTFKQSVEVMRRSDLVFCCDGGLMHAANAVNAKTITLFARLTPEMLLTKDTSSLNLYDKQNVNNISSREILSKYYKATNLFDNHLQDE